MTTDLLQEYMQKVLSSRPGALFGRPCLLVMDSATCHDVMKLNMNPNVHVVKVHVVSSPCCCVSDIFCLYLSLHHCIRFPKVAPQYCSLSMCPLIAHLSAISGSCGMTGSPSQQTSNSSPSLGRGSV